jgi:dipeptidyl aminopeptidase/acylaminoacyl peptidase
MKRSSFGSLPVALALVVGCAPSRPPPEGNDKSADFATLLAETNGKVEQFHYSPDGSRIAYLSARNGDHHIWVMNADGTDARPINPHNPVRLVSDGASVQPRWSPDGTWISYRSRGLLFKVRPDGSAPPVNLTYGRRGSAPMWTPDGERLVFVTGGPRGYSQIATIPSKIPDGPIEFTYVTDAPYNHSDPQVSPDGRYVAYTSDRRGKDDIRGNDIWVRPLTRRSGEERALTPNTVASFDYSPRWSPDGTKIAFVSNRSGWRNIGIIDVASGETRMLTSSTWDEHNPKWSPDGRWIAYVANIEWNYHLMKIPAEGGEPIQLTDRDGVSGGTGSLQTRGNFEWSKDGSAIAYTYMSPTTCSDIWVLPADGGDPHRLTNHMPDGLSGEDFVVPERIDYPSTDGLITVPAFLYRPRVTPADRKPPLLLYARANTHGNHVNGFYPFIQHFVRKGYVVLVPQVRGSQGNGRDYEWLNFGDWGGGDVDDLVAGIDYLASENLTDPDRVVMQGGSTGGFFVMSLIQRYPERLKAAVNFYGPTNLVHMYDMWAPAERPILGDVVGGDHGGPDQAPDHWRERSAYFNIDAIDTPLLILWGDRDYSVRISMADEYFELAKETGKPTEYFLYHDEPHGWYHWRPEDLKDALLRVEAHYAEHLGS